MTILRPVGALLVVLALAAGCSPEPVSPPPPSPTPSSPTSPSPAPASPTPVPSLETSADVDGLTVRYLDSDGRVKTLAVPDFPH